MLALTVMTIMFAPFTVISGLFGMNVHIPWQEIENEHAFIGLFIFMVSVSCILLLIFKLLKWI
jgi:Mg2+ and Co2+ transporter CorA